MAIVQESLGFLLAFSVFAVGLHPAPASATPTPTVTETIGATTYSITYVEASFASLTATLEAEPWWGNSSLAANFALTVGSTLGTPNSPTAGAYFAYTISGNVVSEAYAVPPGSVGARGSALANTFTSYAEATAVASVAVPEPASLAVLGSAFAALALVRSRRAKPSCRMSAV